MQRINFVIKSQTKSLIVPIFLLLNSGCLGLNSVDDVSNWKFQEVPKNAAVVSFGLAVEDQVIFLAFGIGLDKYDPVSKRIEGNCWRYDRIRAHIPYDSAEVRYFAFEVPPGYYIWSAINNYKLANVWGFPFYSGFAFVEIRKGTITYLGDFVYVGKRSYTLPGGRVQYTWPTVEVRIGDEHVQKFLSYSKLKAQDINVPNFANAVGSGGMVICYP